jgi:uncharacterized radical SAM protein YgiQ
MNAPHAMGQPFRHAPFLPMSRAEMDELGWDSCDIILVTGDAYIDHPSFGMALIGRLLEAQGFRVGIISQPDWLSAKAFRALGRPNLFFGVTAGNMDSMVNRYTADRKPRSDDAYTPNGEPTGGRTARSSSMRSAVARPFPAANVVIGSIEASLRRIAHYDYWSDKVRRSVLPDSKADLLILAAPSGRSSNWRTVWPPASRSPTSATCAAPPSWCRAAGCRARTGPKSIRPRSIRRGC